MKRSERIRIAIEQALAPVRLEIEDESDRHAGHSGWRAGGETHFRIVVVAEAFAGMNRVARERLIHRILAEEFATGLHALSITARTPAP